MAANAVVTNEDRLVALGHQSGLLHCRLLELGLAAVGLGASSGGASLGLLKSKFDSGKALTELHSSDGVVTYGGAVPFTLLVDLLQAEVGIVL